MLRFSVGCALSLIALPMASALTSDEQLGLGMGLGVGLGVLLGVVFISYMVCVRARAPEVAKARDEDLIYAAPETKMYMVPVPSTTSVAVPAEVVVVDGAATSAITVSTAAAAAAPVVMPAVGSATPAAPLNKHVEVMSRTSMYAGKEVRAHKVTSLGRGRRGSTATPIPDAAALAPRGSTPVYPDLVDKEAAAAAEGATPLAAGKPSLESAGQDDVAVGLADGEVEGEGAAPAGPKYDEDGEEIHEGVPAHKIHVEFRPQEGPVLGSAAKQLRIKQLHRADSQGNAVTMFASPDDVRHRLAIKAGNAAGGGGSPFAGARRESVSGGAARRASGVAGASNGTPGFGDAIAAARRGSGTSATGGGIPRPPSAATNI